MPEVVIKDKPEYQPIVDILEMAISRFETYNDSFIKIIVKDAQLLVRDQNNRRIVDRRVYEYSATLSHMTAIKLKGFNPDALTKKDFIEILKYFRSL